MHSVLSQEPPRASQCGSQDEGRLRWIKDFKPWLNTQYLKVLDSLR
jgi:hypothetical protein